MTYMNETDYRTLVLQTAVGTESVLPYIKGKCPPKLIRF